MAEAGEWSSYITAFGGRLAVFLAWVRAWHLADIFGVNIRYRRALAAVDAAMRVELVSIVPAPLAASAALR